MKKKSDDRLEVTDGMGVDRRKLSSSELYQFAVRKRIPLSQCEKDRVSADYLYLLAITIELALTQRDRDRLQPLHLAHLAVTERIVLSAEDKSRLPTALLFQLIVQGVVRLSQGEFACYGEVEMEYLKKRQAGYLQSLVSV